MKIGSGVNKRNRHVVRLSSQLYIDRNEEIIGNIGWTALKLRRVIKDKRGQDGNE